MRIQIDKIKVNPGRREAQPEHIEELAKSIAEVGLLNPITVDLDYTLIAGLHRMEAAKSLGWSEIECTVSTLEGLQAELAEIDENFVRRDLSTVEFGDLLLRRKEIYEALHPETKARNLPGHTSNYKSSSVKMTLEDRSFVQDTADKLGVGKRTVERQIQTAKNLTPKTKDVIRHSDVSKEMALKLSRLNPEQQEEAAGLLVSGTIKSVEEYLARKSACHAETHAQPGQAGPVVIEGSNQPPQTPQSAETAAQSNQECENTERSHSRPRTQDQAMRRAGEKKCEREKSVPSEHAEVSPAHANIPPDPPYSLGGVKYSTIRESVADLKNPNKDCSNTADSFLAEITEFVHKFQQEIGWFHIADYEPVFPILSQFQFEYFQRQMNEIHDAVKHLFNHVQKGRDKNE